MYCTSPGGADPSAGNAAGGAGVSNSGKIETLTNIGGMINGGKIVSFERVGPRILMVQGNENFRSSSANPEERRSVEDSFAKSVLWGFAVAAESNDRVLVDATDFFLRDGHGAGGSLGAGPAAYRVDRTRSAVYLPRTKAFPKNTDIEVTLTFTN